MFNRALANEPNPDSRRVGLSASIWHSYVRALSAVPLSAVHRTARSRAPFVPGTYRRGCARAKSQTAEYAAIRQEHPAIERKLNEILNHQRGRRARYWGIAKVRQQETMTCIAINVKRILKLVTGEVCFG